MNGKGYTHDKTTNTWRLNDELNTSNATDNKFSTPLKHIKQNSIENENISIVDDLKDFLKENSKNKIITNSSKSHSDFEEENNKNISDNATKNIKESSCIPEENIINEIWKIADNNSSNLEVLMSNLLTLSKQLSENTSLLTSLNATSKEINNNDYYEVPSNQIMAIKCSDSKRYELTLPIAFVDAIKQKFFLKHPEVNSIEKLKDCKILDMILWDYFTSK